MTLPFLYQLQGAEYSSLFSGDFRVAVIDMDDSSLTAGQIDTLQQDQDKILITYLSIGEAEDYRDYWQDGNWSTSAPDFLLGENPDWAGNYLVKFWDPTWQATIFARVDEALDLGYNGVYLDIVDAYTVAQVKNAYPGTNEELRQEMVAFVIALSNYAKAQDPDFMIVPQNAVGLLAVNEGNPDSGPNTPYLDAIDGLGVEDLWYDGNNTAGWTSGDLQYIEHALSADKFVLATSYPTQDAKQDTFIANAIDAGLIPFVADRDLTGTIDASNLSIEANMGGHDINAPWDAVVGGTTSLSGGTSPSDGSGDTGSSSPSTGTTPSTTLDDVSFTAHSSGGVISGGLGNDQILNLSKDSSLIDVQDPGVNPASLAVNDVYVGGVGNDTIRGLNGNDILIGDVSKSFGGNDIIDGGTGIDLLEGGGGEDIFVFHEGDSQIDDGSGTFVMIGGGDMIGAFDLGTGYGADVADITGVIPVAADFQVGLDAIQLVGFANAADIQDNLGNYLSSDAEGNAVFEDAGTRVTIFGVSAGELSIDDFSFI